MKKTLDKDRVAEEPKDKVPEKIGLGLAHMHGKRMEKVKKLWKGTC